MSALEVQKAVIDQNALRLRGSPGQHLCLDRTRLVDVVSESLLRLLDSQVRLASCVPLLVCITVHTEASTETMSSWAKKCTSVG